MKYIKIVLILAIVISSTFSCKEKKAEKKEYLRPASMVFSKQDSTDINKLVSTFVDNINNHDLNAASSALYEVKDGKAEYLPLEKRKSFEQFIAKLPYRKCKQEAFTLRGAKDNKIRIALLITPDGDIDKQKGVINIVLNPVNIDNKWYLTLRDENAEGVEQEEAL